MGNDFLIVGAQTADILPSALASGMCDRHAGVGADGLVFMGPAARADASFRIYNADGSEATLSGNALRCAAAWLLAQRGEREYVILETRVGLREQWFLKRHGNTWWFRAEIGRPSFAAADVPFHPPRHVSEPVVRFPLPVGDVVVPATILSMGNPQCIVFLEDVPGVAWERLGAAIERHAFFPDRTNVGFVRALTGDRLEARFYERGAGHTLASGTGSCACAVASHLAGRTGRHVTVQVECGEMEVNWRADEMVELTGPAQLVAEGAFLWETA